MPIKRKICRIGTGLAVFLPKSWIDLIEERHGPVRAVAIEVDEKLIVTPILQKQKGRKGLIYNGASQR